MESLAKIKALISAASTAERDATVRLRELFSPGDAIEFKCGNMICIHNARILRICTLGGLGVIILNEDTGTERKIPVSAIVGHRVDEAPAPVSGLHVWVCAQCSAEIPTGGPLLPACKCKRVLCQACYGFCKECN